MGWTKRQFIEQAFDEIGLAPYTFDLTADQLQSALRKLDSMMAMWNAKGIRLGFPLPASPNNSDLDTDTLVPDSAIDAICLNLAMKIAPSFGKGISLETRSGAKAAYDAMLLRFSMPMEMQFVSTLPTGAGNKNSSSDAPFFGQPVDRLLVGDDGALEFL